MLVESCKRGAIPIVAFYVCARCGRLVKYYEVCECKKMSIYRCAENDSTECSDKGESVVAVPPWLLRSASTGG